MDDSGSTFVRLGKGDMTESWGVVECSDCDVSVLLGVPVGVDEIISCCMFCGGSDIDMEDKGMTGFDLDIL
jgi:hypothetical protein